MQDLNAIAIFAEVAKAGSFSAAAKNLRVPLSTVSRKVSELEAQLGTKLLERTTRRMRLTEIGEQFYKTCLPGLELSEPLIEWSSNASRFVGRFESDDPAQSGRSALHPRHRPVPPAIP
ncbi:LysR family transcriptional regulator [Pseudovibrio denitrificans]|uniref:LysR family transcriptional regulator n=1 Tax=Pseudovibrio denitrificans TaxID=258256 RepID=UPI000A96BE08|nr:LysR family transcriptional regulator [Pseudovibrio denitrificans]